MNLFKRHKQLDERAVHCSEPHCKAFAEWTFQDDVYGGSWVLWSGRDPQLPATPFCSVHKAAIERITPSR